MMVGAQIVFTNLLIFGQEIFRHFQKAKKFIILFALKIFYPPKEDTRYIQ